MLYVGDVYAQAFHQKSLGFIAIMNLLNENMDAICLLGGAEAVNGWVSMRNVAYIGESRPSRYMLPLQHVQSRVNSL